MTEETKKTVQMATKAAVEVSQNRKDAATTVRDMKKELIASRKLWKEGEKSKLVQIGMALIVFPEPTPVSEIVGAGFLAAAAVQKGIKSQSVYLDDIPKSLKSAFKEICNDRYNIRI